MTVFSIIVKWRAGITCVCSEVCVYAVCVWTSESQGMGHHNGGGVVVSVSWDCMAVGGQTDRQTARQLTMTLRRAPNPRKREQGKKKKYYVASPLPPLN